jgi:predicted ATPase/DNA-binding SARP family transcriptional activator
MLARMSDTETDTGVVADSVIGRGMQVRLLGGFAVLVDDRAVPESAWRLRRAKDVVKLLALADGHRLHREQVMEALWPERSPEATANNLHQALHVARRALRSAGGSTDLLRLRDGVLHLSPEGELRIDAEAYSDAAGVARASRDVSDYLEARALYRGALLPDDRYEDWCTAARDALEQDHLSLLWELAARQSEIADLAGAVQTLRALVAIDPAHEAAHRELMRAYALDGRRRLALRQFQVLRTTLRRELDVDPSDETGAVYEDILQGRLGSAETTSFESAAAPVAAVVAAGPRSSPEHNLPVALSSFVGRQRETGDIGRLLGGARLLTLTGPGGCGKTRLAIEAAWDARGAFADGVWLVQLAPLGHESLVVQAVAEVFEVREQAGTPLLDSVIAHLAERRVLVVLDNCEHLVDGCAQLAQALLSSCAQLRVMTTSREPLRIAGEVVFRVPSLVLPDPSGASSPDELAAISSVQLFVERAQAVAPGFELTADNAGDVAGLCYHLDGLPLAIELAASRVASLQPSAIAERLSDRFRLLVGGDRTAIGRQQTLKATLDWSYRLLSDAEQAVLRRLAVFVGGIPLDAAEDVCAGDVVERGDVLPVIGALVDKSLTVPLEQGGEPRFRLLETVREYGMEQLDAVSEREGVESRHAAWFLDLTERVRAALPLPQRGALLERLELEHDNVRAAFDRRVGPDPALALRFAANLWHFWLWRGYLAEGRRRIELATSRVSDPSSDRAEALLGVAALAIRSGAVDVGPDLARSSVDLAERIGDHRLACRALQVLGVVVWSKDELMDAESIYEESLAIATKSGFEPGRAAAMHGLGIVAWYSGNQDRSAALLRESLAAFRGLVDNTELAPPMLDVGEFLVPHTATGGLRIAFQETFGTFIDVPCRTAVGYVLANEGMLAGLAGDLRRARERTEESLELFEELGDDRAIGQSLARLGNLAAAADDFARARELLEQASEVRTKIGDWRGVMMTQLGLGNLAVEEGELDEADRLLHEAASTFHRRGDKWGYVGALSDLANLALAEGDTSEAKARLEESIELAEITRRPRWVAWAWVQLGEIARIEGDAAAADASVARALEMFARVGDAPGARHCRALLERRSAGRPLAT